MSAMFASLRACARSPLSVSSLTTRTLSALPRRPMPLPNAPLARMLPQIRSFHPSPASSATLNQAMKRKKPQSKKIKESRSPLLTNSPQKKGVCSQIFIMKPKKPNSAKRKVARIKLSNGSTLMAYIQGEGHNLQEHSVVMIRGGRAQDLPGVKYKIVRGALDFGGVIGRQTARSRYGAKKPKK